MTRSRKPKLSSKLDRAVIDYVSKLQSAGATINTTVIIRAPRGATSKLSPGLLLENGGHLILGESWAESPTQRLGFSCRRATEVFRKKPQDYELQRSFLFQIEQLVYKKKIPDDMVLNMDQTAVRMVPTANWTISPEGSKQVPLTAVDDKREVTVLLSITTGGSMLAAQVIEHYLVWAHSSRCVVVIICASNARSYMEGRHSPVFLVSSEYIQILGTSPTARIIGLMKKL